MKKKLLIVTQGYPFTRGEASFLEPELPALKELFALRIASCYPVPDFQGTAPFGIPAADIPRGSAFRATLRILASRALWRDIFTGLRRGGGFQTTYRRLGFLYNSHLHAAQYADTLRRRVFSDFVPDLAYSFWAREPAYALVLLKKQYPHMRIVTRLHGYDLYDSRVAEGMQPFRQALAEGLDALCFVSENGRAYWRKTLPGTAEEKLWLCPLGTFAAGRRVRPEESPFVLVSCSRATGVKRLDRIVRALAKTSGVRLEWHHIGDGESLPEIKELAGRLLSEKEAVRAVFPGYMPSDAICPYYRRAGAGLLLNVSESEGLPVSIMEAFSVGLPAMGTDVGGVPEIIGPENGVRLPANVSDAALAEAIMAFAHLPAAEWNRLSDGAYRTWQSRFDAQKNAAAFAERLSLQWDQNRDTIITNKSDGKEHKSMGKFVIREGKSGCSFVLKAGNGETILVSESYAAESSCKNGIESVKKNASAPVEDQTKEDYKQERNPKYEVYADKKGEFRFRLKAGNGEIIAASEGYKAKSSCLNGIESVKKNAPGADVVKE